LFLALTPSIAPSVLGAEPTNPIMPGEVRTYSTIHSIGIEWDVTGDANHNASCKVHYRPQGATEWRPALDLFRIDYYGWYGDQKADRSYNMLAGSVMFLDPDTTYAIKLALSDSDGGGDDRILSVKTRRVPALSKNGRTFHVIPGSGGGDGMPAQPFKGLQSAQSVARPGDVFLLHKGNYETFDFAQSGSPEKYIAWKGAGAGDAVFSRATISAGHVWIEGLVFERGPASSNGLTVNGSPEGVVISRNRFSGYHYSITLKPTCRNWYIADNVIVGDKENPDVSDISGEGIELNHGSGHVVAYNRIARVADGISYPHRNCDLYGNDIRDVTDDGIEPDYGYANIRIWGNRIHNPFNEGFSFQPQFCGPWYFVRNEVVTKRNMLKPNVADRFVLVNNTLVSRGRYAQGRADLLFKSLSRNNLWILIHDRNAKDETYAIWQSGKGGRGGPYSMEYQALPDWRTDVDYDGFDWDQTPTPFWWDLGTGRVERYKDLPSLSQAVRIERHALRVRKEELFEVPDILAYVAEPYSAKRLTLRKDCAAIDAGQPLPNLCDDFNGRAPDLGAYESGKPAPHYGPRP
jgi:hypothetical protein